ncbi:MAG: type IIL restriction-modification enzyme MmeI, partial [Synechocystis sp.]
PERDKNRMTSRRVNWWQPGGNPQLMRKKLKPLNYSFAVPRVSKWAVSIPFYSEWLAGDKSVVIASDDFYVLGILTSDVHRQWMHAQKSTLEDRIAYTHNTCFETFPFPQTASEKLTQQIRQAMIELHEYRSQQMEAKQWGITKLYNAFFAEPASQLYKLHKKLDNLVMKAYEFQPDDDILEKLLHLNLELAEKENQGESIIGPWAVDNPPKS